MSRHGFIDLIPLVSEPLLLCPRCEEFRRLPTVPMGIGAIALILSHETYKAVWYSCFTMCRHCKIRLVELSGRIRAVK
jgi:hypothetical protein